MTTNVNESVLQSSSSSLSYARGVDLYHSDAIFDTCRQGDTLHGKCEGSSAPFYRLSVQLDEGGIRGAFCDCPYDWGGYCKHIIALMLTYIHRPDVFIEQKSIEELMAQLDKDTLVSLVAQLADTNPDVNDWLQAAIKAESDKSQEGQPGSERKTKVSKTVYKRQIQSILNSLRGCRMSQACWMMGGMIDQLDQILNTACDFLGTGDAHGALVILTTLLDEVGESLNQYDDSDGLLGFFLNELALPTVKAIFSAGLSKNERRSLFHELKPVITQLYACGIIDPGVVLAALNSGWSDEALGEPEDYVYDENLLYEARLNLLESQDQTGEYLRLCLEAGMHRRYVLKQIELGKIETAREVARENLTEAGEVLEVARALREAGRLPDALQLARKGLELNGSRYDVGIWLGQIEETQGHIEQAVQAYRAAFDSLPSLELYNMLKKLSGENWEDLRPALLHRLQNSLRIDVLVDVYLCEEEWDEAIGVVGQAGEWNYALLEKVVDVVLPFRPDWVIEASRKQAEGLIARKQKKYYIAAARWLAKMKQAYLSAGRKADWEVYLGGLKSTYARRPSLQTEMKRLS